MKKQNTTTATGRGRQQPELFWPRIVVRKLLNINAKNSDYSADSDSGSDSDQEICDWPRESRFKKEKSDEVQIDDNAMHTIPEALPRLRRRNSETFRAQYINNKKIRICAATWNVGGRVPSDDLDLDDWIDINDPADLYVIGRIIWLGDLNYRINLSYEKTRELISNKDWSNLIKYDQLISEFRKDRAFDGWSEGTLNFAPTYKYETNSKSYSGEDPRAGRRTPAWCDRILSFGTGMRLLSYRRTELMLSDHRPVSASFTVDVEEFSSRKLQRALTLTDAEVEERDIGICHGISMLRSGEDASYWER
ncbi:unnamed protein product [Fraxinus pennsylvanica]|uniref:Inositol polyphosphate-related phosphatase domain-containing protein n=1 Tax=Fraxinus pennsylvanica TaxID=56036 RepID=A0AAD1Z648_9LAMI|nr:unnamed protein product [Fraxinus pennsylvanica]